jgi:REP element-mobilizing transposase RayT
MDILAYLITWTTYGTWLPGDERGWVGSPGTGIQPPDPEREQNAALAMAEDAVTLTREQRDLAEQTIHDHCRIRGWALHAVNARTNHVHVVVTADRDGKVVRDQFKAWCSQKLSDQAGLTTPVARKAGRRHWFTEGGSCKVIDNEEYLKYAIAYVLEGQGG